MRGRDKGRGEGSEGAREGETVGCRERWGGRGGGGVPAAFISPHDPLLEYSLEGISVSYHLQTAGLPPSGSSPNLTRNSKRSTKHVPANRTEPVPLGLADFSQVDKRFSS